MSVAALYNAVEYPSKPIPECHPSRMATIAALAGLTPPPLSSATVLDIGCATATNLISIATAYPSGEVIGVDPSAEQLARARELASEADLANTTFLEGTSSRPDDGHADYVVVHGVLSWVADDVRPGVVAEAARSVRPGGLVLLSFNVDPGSLERTIVHTLGRRAAAAEIAAGDPKAAQAAVIARLKLAVRLAGPGTVHGQLAASEAERVAHTDPGVLFHDELTPNWTPLSFSTVVELARAAGLEYVGMLRAADRWRLRIPANQAKMIEEQAGDDVLAQQQLVDDAFGPAFHSCLFVRGDAPTPDAPVAGPPAESWHVASARSTWPTVPGAERQAVAEAVRAAGRLGISVGSIAEATGVPAPDVIDIASGFDARQLATLRTEEPPLGREPGAHPQTSPLVRAQLARGYSRVTALSHESVSLEDPLLRALAALADGSRDRDAIARDLAAAPGGESLDAAALDANLTALAEAGLFTP